MATTYISDEEIELAKKRKLREQYKKLTTYYRQNIHRFVTEYLGLSLYLFQKILLYEMSKNDYFMFLASRSIGKTYLVALFAVAWAILYPNSKIVIASGTKQQACEVLSKIETELMPKSKALRKEIININSSPSGVAKCTFRNNSYIKAVTSSDDARGERATVLVCDEFRMVNLNVITTVLQKFIGAVRDIPFSSKPEYIDKKEQYNEQGKEIYMSSAWYKNHWSFNKAKEYLDKMIKGGKYFVCALPYQLQLQCGMTVKQRVIDEMSSPNFDQVAFDIESSCIWYGSGDGKFYSEKDIDKNRVLLETFPNIDNVLDGDEEVPDLEQDERRILSIDIALMASKKNKDNDATSIQINRALWTGFRYEANIVKIDNREGILTQDLCHLILTYFYEYKCTDIALDTRGIGGPIFDNLTDNYYNEHTGKLYYGVTACNNDDYAERCKNDQARPVVWCMMGSKSFNGIICTLLRTGLQSSQVHLPVDEFIAEDYFVKNKIFNSLSEVEQANRLMTYRQTTLLKHELISLVSEVSGSNVTVKEISGMRKDRYSSLAYNYYVMKEIERQFDGESQYDDDDMDEIMFRQPVYF